MLLLLPVLLPSIIYWRCCGICICRWTLCLPSCSAFCVPSLWRSFSPGNSPSVGLPLPWCSSCMHYYLPSVVCSGGLCETPLLYGMRAAPLPLPPASISRWLCQQPLAPRTADSGAWRWRWEYRHTVILPAAFFYSPGLLLLLPSSCRPLITRLLPFHTCMAILPEHVAWSASSVFQHGAFNYWIAFWNYACCVISLYLECNGVECVELLPSATFYGGVLLCSCVMQLCHTIVLPWCPYYCYWVLLRYGTWVWSASFYYYASSIVLGVLLRWSVHIADLLPSMYCHAASSMGGFLCYVLHCATIY